MQAGQLAEHYLLVLVCFVKPITQFSGHPVPASVRKQGTHS